MREDWPELRALITRYRWEAWLMRERGWSTGAMPGRMLDLSRVKADVADDLEAAWRRL